MIISRASSFLGPSLERAHDLLLHARYSEAISELLQLPRSIEGYNLLARAYLRKKDLRAAREVISEARAFDGATAADLRVCEAMDAFAAAALGQRSEAETRISAAIGANAFPQTQTDVDYYIACAKWMIGDTAMARTIITPYIKSTDSSQTSIRFDVLLAWLLAAEGEYQQQGELLLRIVRDSCNATSVDMGILADAVYSLSALARDIDLPGAIEAVRNCERMTIWPSDLALAQFQITRVLGWAESMQGNFVSAIRHMNAAAKSAQDPWSNLLASLDQAWVATISEQFTVAQAALEDAKPYINENWSTRSGDEAGAFVLAAELFAQTDVRTAESALELAQVAFARIPLNNGYAHDRRFAAMLDYADALVREASGQRRTARHRAARAYEVFSQIGYVWRAGRCATLLYRLTGDRRWLRCAEAAVQVYPRSFLASDVWRLTHEGAYEERLTSRQRQILGMLKQGLTNAQIAAALDCSPNTVRIHVGNIYAALKVPRKGGIRGLLRTLGTSRDNGKTQPL